MKTFESIPLELATLEDVAKELSMRGKYIVIRIDEQREGVGYEANITEDLEERVVSKVLRDLLRLIKHT